MDEWSFALCQQAAAGPVHELRWGSVTLRASEPCSVGAVGASTHQTVDLAAGESATLSVAPGLTLYWAAFRRAMNLPVVTHDATAYFVPAEDGEAVGFALEATTANTRMGVRLKGCLFDPGPERPSRPCEVGTLQLTPDGTVLALGPDGPTIGGYRQLGTLIRASRHLMANWLPGQTVRFQPLTLEEARHRYQRYQAALMAQREALRMAIVTSE
jgi:allophanate hydrolase subunit 2